MWPTLIPLKLRTDSRGALVALEEMHEVPFRIRRMYFVFGIPRGVVRGGHAHRKNRQVAVAVAGGCRFRLDDGGSRAEVVLDCRDRALVIEPMVWHEMAEFSSDCVVVILASDLYDEADYIRTYDEFLEAVGEGQHSSNG